MQRKLTITLMGLMILILGSVPVIQAQTVLSNNSGTENQTFFIDGEQTLILNGFDLTPLNLSFPITVNALTLSVVQPVAGQTATMVVYADGNGGSPVDAQLVGQAEVTINGTGIVRVAFPEPVEFSSPVMWAGFYLPVGFEFSGDASGSSVLTYWGWTPGATFDLTNLGSAQVFGPADGSEPVNIDMGGVARMSVEVSQSAAGGAPASGASGEVTTSTGTSLTSQPGEVGVQIASDVQGDLSVLRQYPYCGELLFYDNEDIALSARDAFDLYCRADLGPFSPGQVRNEDRFASGITTMERRGFLYEIFAGGAYQADSSNAEKLAVPVTHCIRPDQADLEQAVIGIAYGASDLGRVWSILPSVRYGEVVCAEVTHIGFISYFIPRTGEEPNNNSNLYFIGLQRFIDPNEPNNDSIRCGFLYDIDMAIRNEGFEDTPPIVVRVEDINVRNGVITQTHDYTVGPIVAGDTDDILIRFWPAPTVFFEETHFIQITVDATNVVAEFNEEDNVFGFQYTLEYTNKCG